MLNAAESNVVGSSSTHAVSAANQPASAPKLTPHAPLLIESLVRDVREGHITPPDATSIPRLRLLDRLDLLAALPYHGREATMAATPPERVRLQVETAVSGMARKCRQQNACLACCMSPCACCNFPPLPGLSHRLWVVQHCKEVMRTTATGKLLLLAHPNSTLLVGGVPDHDAELARVCRRSSAVVLYPSPDALSPPEALHAAVNHRTDRGNDGAVYGDVTVDGSLDILVLDGTWSQARNLFRLLPPDVRKVAVDCTALRSSFGTRVRRQGAEREAAGRVSTLEAYAHLALALGDDPAVVAQLMGYLETFIDSLPYSRAPLETNAYDSDDAHGANNDSVSGGAPMKPPLPPLPARTPTCQMRRRGRTLKNELVVDGAVAVWGKAGRALLGDFLEANPQLNGRTVQWRFDAQERVATLVLMREGWRGATPPAGHDKPDEEVLHAWHLSELLAESEEDVCRDVRRTRTHDWRT